MSLRKMLLEEHSKQQKDKIVAYVLNNQGCFSELVEIFLAGEYRTVQRAAWPLSDISIQQPQLVKTHLKKIVARLKKDNIHNAVKRNTLRMLQCIPIPKNIEGEVMQLCFQYLESPTEPVAIKAFSITILQNLAAIYPEIIPEIKLLISEQTPHQTAAFKSRAKKALKQFSQL